MSADWEKDLGSKEHINWVKLGCALNITKKGIAPLVQSEIDKWYQKLLHANAGLKTPCSCAGRKGGKCPGCADWQRELKRLHRRGNPTLANCNEKDWRNASTGAWEAAKAYISILGNRKSDVTSAETTDLGGLLNILLMCKFLSFDKNRDETAKKVSNARNCWAHAPNHTIADSELGNMLGDIQALLTDPVFKTDADAIKALRDLQDMKREGIRNIKESELNQLVELRRTLNEELGDLLEAQNLVKKCRLLQSEVDDLKTSAQETEDLPKRLHDVEQSIKRFNDLINRRIDLQNDIDFIKITKRVEFIEASFEKLGGDVENLKDKVEVLEMENQKAQETEVICNLPERNRSFTGRENELEWLDNCFIKKSHDGEKSTGCTCCVISGLGGNGKTSLAVEFGCRYQTQFPGGIFWINGESEANIEKSVNQILSPNLNSEKLSKASNQERLSAFLAHLDKQESPWLLILDNADELDDSKCPDSLKDILKWRWQKRNGNILLTSRQNEKQVKKRIKQHQPGVRTLDCLDPEEATAFLINSCKMEDADTEEKTRNEAHKLALELGCLPLALSQAAAYISDVECSFESYLDEYRRVKSEILSKEPTQAVSSESVQRLSVKTTCMVNEH